MVLLNGTDSPAGNPWSQSGAETEENHRNDALEVISGTFLLSRKFLHPGMMVRGSKMFFMRRTDGLLGNYNINHNV